ncbi:right-handed parallel beta-helix repeat-containing protein [Actinomadura alba]|uniref:Right handed beta helix domain-containing protein n=1 Tax=Actinomadura alba TaxID=406431 RepID=A0ABR7LJ48_9ACTN|nr:right-handed parallel beta-helix repeat-containing protein [Actinomadura alba]MBC6464801.1 hypothetical protein [Actinomadura alba]
MSFGGGRVTVARVSHPALVGAVVAVVWFVIAAMPGGGTSTGRQGKEAGRSVAERALAAIGAGKAFRVYLHPQGSDAANGVTPGTAVRSLAAAQRVIAAARPKSDVEVRVAQGDYVAPPLKWTTFVPGHAITFLPIDYEIGESADGIAGRPVFRGEGSPGFWFRALFEQGGHRGDTRLRFFFLRVEGYSEGGITFDGGTAVNNARMVMPASGGMNGNTVHGMVFHELGSKHTGRGVGYGAIDLINSRDNLIQDNEFTLLENSGGSGNEALIHGVYLSHHSSANVIKNNRFYLVSGDPIRTRNASDANKVFGNTFRRTGANAYISDWFVDGAKQGSDGAAECASKGNVFYDNRLISGYRAGVETWWVSPGGAGYPGRGCGHGGDKRVRSWGNRVE